MPTAPTIHRSQLPIAKHAWLAALVFGLGAFLLFTRHNDFPFYYHTDEPGKVKQVLTGERNFHHPLLLLCSTEWLMRLTGAPHQWQPAVQAGRTVSALFGALTVAALVVLAWQLGGAVAGMLAGILVLTHPVLFELAHYMKEDCSLLVGIAWCFVAMAYYTRRPSIQAAMLCGAAFGLAVSGKYIGITVGGAALCVLLAGGGKARWIHTGAFLMAGVVVFGAINFQSFLRPAAAASGLGSEFTTIDKRIDQAAGRFRIRYLSEFGTTISLPILLASAWWASRRWRLRRSEPLFTWVLLGFPLLLAAGLSVAPRTKERYLLPVFALFCVIGALGIADLARAGSQKHKIAAAVLAILAIGWHLPALAGNFREFSTDDRRELIAWIRQNLPADALIAHDKRVYLGDAQQSGDPRYAFPQRVLSARHCVASFGTLDELRARGVRYVAVCEPDYSQLLRGAGSRKREKTAQAEFYRHLFRDGKLLWESQPQSLTYLHPGLRLYQIE